MNETCDILFAPFVIIRYWRDTFLNNVHELWQILYWFDQYLQYECYLCNVTSRTSLSTLSLYCNTTLWANLLLWNHCLHKSWAVTLLSRIFIYYDITKRIISMLWYFHVRYPCALVKYTCNRLVTKIIITLSCSLKKISVERVPI